MELRLPMNTTTPNQSGRSVQSQKPERLRPAGGYRTTASSQTTTLIYDATYWFCEKFFDPHSRLADQMVMATRNGWQNIAEGSRFATTAPQTELRLLNTARASLEELLLDFEDYFFHRHLPQWARDSKQARVIRALAAQLRRDQSDQSDRSDQSASIPYCPRCGKLMPLRTAKTGQHTGRQFWGYTNYPNSKNPVEL